MTEETANKIVEVFEAYEQALKAEGVLMAVVLLIALGLLIFTLVFAYQKEKKIKQWRAEYKATLTEDQLKAIEQYNKIK